MLAFQAAMEIALPGEIAPELGAWLRSEGGRAESLQALAGDVSTRRYFRLSRGRTTAILAVYPQDQREVGERFLATTGLFREVGVRTPEVLAWEAERGWMLLADLGPVTLYDLGHQPWTALAPCFAAAAALIERIHRLPAERLRAMSPPLDAALLRRELRQTWNCYLLPAGLTGGAAEAGHLEEALERMVEELSRAEPQPCHRDFMARNLVPCDPLLAESSELWVLDHQDARLGPPYYDLASLLNDSLFPPKEVEEVLVARSLRSPSDRTLYHRVAAQRTLKAVGTFAAFASRGCDRHLPLIPPTFCRALDHLAHLPEVGDAGAALRRRWQEAFC